MVRVGAVGFVPDATRTKGVCLKETQCPITRRHAIGQSADRFTKQILLDFRCVTYMDEIVGDYLND
jgi:hypothetical protein